MAALWGDGTTSSSDGQYFPAGGRAGPGGAINAKYGIDPGAVLYTHVSGQYGPSIRLVDADGLMDVFCGRKCASR
jgi:TnpA family transposase